MHLQSVGRTLHLATGRIAAKLQKWGQAIFIFVRQWQNKQPNEGLCLNMIVRNLRWTFPRKQKVYLGIWR